MEGSRGNLKWRATKQTYNLGPSVLFIGVNNYLSAELLKYLARGKGQTKWLAFITVISH